MQNINSYEMIFLNLCKILKAKVKLKQREFEIIKLKV